MPKILQKKFLSEICKFLLFSVICYIIAIPICIYAGKKPFAGPGYFNGLEYTYTSLIYYNMFFFYLDYLDGRLPDYIFIAPFSLKERMAMHKKFFFYSIIAKWAIAVVFVLVPYLAEYAVYGILQAYIKSIFIMLTIFYILFVSGFYKYFNTTSYMHGTILAFQELLILALSEAVIITRQLHTAGYILLAITSIISIAAILYYYFKHYGAMCRYYSDYELSMQLKDRNKK